MKSKRAPRFFPHKSQAGMTLLETTIALAVLLVASVGIMTMATIAITTTENQGHLAARTAEYAQDKMEQLISLAYGDPTTDTTVFPATSTGGTGLSVGGSSDPTAPVTGYVDYLDVSGNPLASGGGAPANWYYIRVWQISTPAGTSNLKQVTVSAMVRSEVGSSGVGALPRSTLVSLKTNPF
jgi:type II secretory pathway pseudopilin PulG